MYVQVVARDGQICVCAEWLEREKEGLGENKGRQTKKKKESEQGISTMAMIIVRPVSTTNAIDPSFFVRTKKKDGDMYIASQHHAGGVNVLLCVV